jgi:hypothetical protein
MSLARLSRTCRWVHQWSLWLLLDFEIWVGQENEELLGNASPRWRLCWVGRTSATWYWLPPTAQVNININWLKTTPTSVCSMTQSYLATSPMHNDMAFAEDPRTLDIEMIAVHIMELTSQGSERWAHGVESRLVEGEVVTMRWGQPLFGSSKSCQFCLNPSVDWKTIMFRWHS